MLTIRVDDLEINSTESFFKLPVEIQEKIKLVVSPIFESEFNELIKEIERLNTDIVKLHNDLIPYELLLFNSLESILQDKRAFYEPGTATFKLKDGKFIKEVSIDPRDLICVYTPVKGRKKAFILREDVISPTGQTREVYRLYELNSNDLNYDEIKKMIDPISNRFVKIAKSTLVNVAYYRFDKKNELIFERELVLQESFSHFIVTLKGASDMFEFVKMHWQENYSLQKRITDYMKSEIGSGRP
jgi:hypothetical protein